MYTVAPCTLSGDIHGIHYTVYFRLYTVAPCTLSGDIHGTQCTLGCTL